MTLELKVKLLLYYTVEVEQSLGYTTSPLHRGLFLMPAPYLLISLSEHYSDTKILHRYK